MKPFVGSILQPSLDSISCLGYPPPEAVQSLATLPMPKSCGGKIYPLADSTVPSLPPVAGP